MVGGRRGERGRGSNEGGEGEDRFHGVYTTTTRQFDSYYLFAVIVRLSFIVIVVVAEVVLPLLLKRGFAYPCRPSPVAI